MDYGWITDGFRPDSCLMLAGLMAGVGLMLVALLVRERLILVGLRVWVSWRNFCHIMCISYPLHVLE